MNEGMNFSSLQDRGDRRQRRPARQTAREGTSLPALEGRGGGRGGGPPAAPERREGGKAGRREGGRAGGREGGRAGGRGGGKAGGFSNFAPDAAPRPPPVRGHVHMHMHTCTCTCTCNTSSHIPHPTSHIPHPTSNIPDLIDHQACGAACRGRSGRARGWVVSWGSGG